MTLDPLDAIFLVFCHDPESQENFRNAVQKFGADACIRMIDRLQRQKVLSDAGANDARTFIREVAAGG